MNEDALEHILLDALCLGDVVSWLNAANAHRLKRLCGDSVPKLVAEVRRLRDGASAALRNPAPAEPAPPAQPVVKMHGVRIPGSFNPPVVMFQPTDG